MATNLIPKNTATAFYISIIALASCFPVLFYRSYSIATQHTQDWGHVLVVPFVLGWWVYKNKESLKTVALKPSWLGAPFVLAGCFFNALATLDRFQVTLLQGMAFIWVVIGLILCTGGWNWLKRLFFPLVLMMTAIPISYQYWDVLTHHLQDISATVAGVILDVSTIFMPFEIEQKGNTLTLFVTAGEHKGVHSLNVAQACSGIRMLMAFVAIGCTITCFSKKPWWQKAILLIATVPIAVLSNSLRVAALGMLTPVNPAFTQGDLHLSVGLIMLIPAGLSLLLLEWILDKLFILDPKDKQQATEASASSNQNIFQILPAIKAIAIGFSTLLPVVICWGILLRMSANRNWGVVESAQISFIWIVLTLIIGVGLLCFAVYKKRQSPPLILFLMTGALMAGTTTQWSAVKFTNTVLIKKAIPLRQSLAHLPTNLGPWMLLNEATPLPSEIAEVLGTEHYITRFYVDTRQLSAATITNIKNSNTKNLSAADLPEGSIIRLHMTYYTPAVDAHAHTPDRCFVANGAEFEGRSVIDLPVTSVAENSPEEVQATWFNYKLQDGVLRGAGYFFIANGRLLPTRNTLRIEAVRPSDVTSYAIKIEFERIGINDQDQETPLCSDFISHLWGPIQELLPIEN